MSKEPIIYLKHILDECEFILSIISTDATIENLLEDETMKRAIIRSLEIIGEATKNIPADFRLKWNTVHWKSMAGMRDRLIHNYMGVNYTIVWDVIQNKIPELSKQIAEIIRYEEAGF